ncbi:hypothetical protein M3Y98_00268900 [Aphelenchoides besseyi]|nr:hypothetical protein M3Y98_00268900 [Aphelenchoides besseyi]KAI6200931.1 hypothetical protein M3Y96_00787100 [Aphelenchoides besseyi]
MTSNFEAQPHMSVQHPTTAIRSDSQLTIALNNSIADQSTGFTRQFADVQFQRPPDLLTFYPHTSYSNAVATSNPSTPTASTVSLNRSQRCGSCFGCTRKACGTCNYCLDSPIFGGRGVKKQSCIERRCFKVLEKRLQRDAPTFKARLGCNQCEDCRMNDCLSCIVCLDKRYFQNRYMKGALCAKKRCNNSTNLELSMSNTQSIDRTSLKRSYDRTAPQSTNISYDGHPPIKRLVHAQPQFVHHPQAYSQLRFPPPPNVLSSFVFPDPNFPAQFGGFPSVDCRPKIHGNVHNHPGIIEHQPAKTYETDRLHYPTDALLSTSPLLPISFEALETGISGYPVQDELFSLNFSNTVFHEVNDAKQMNELNQTATDADCTVDQYLPPSRSSTNEIQNPVVLQQL